MIILKPAENRPWQEGLSHGGALDFSVNEEPQDGHGYHSHIMEVNQDLTERRKDEEQ